MGLSIDEIQEIAADWRWPEYSVEAHRAQIGKFYHGAVEKGWAPTVTVWAQEAAGVVQGEDLMAMVMPPITEFVESLIASGCTLLAGKPKKGKSWLLLMLLLCIAGGWIAFNRLRCEKNGILLLALEDSQRRLQSRCRKLLDHFEREIPEDCHFATSWPRGQKGVDALEKFLDEHPTIRAVGIDILARIKDIDNKSKEGSTYSDDYNTIAIYQQLAQRRNIAIIILHHTRKADSGDPIDLVSGTLGIVGAVDHVALLTGNKESGYQFTASGRDVVDVHWDVELRDGVWSIIGDHIKHKLRATKLSPVERMDRNAKVRAMRAEGATEQEIVDELGVAKSTVQRILTDPTYYKKQ